MPAIYTLTINYDDGVEKCEISVSNTSSYTTIENGGNISIGGNIVKYFKITPKSGYSVDSVVSTNYSIEDQGNNIWAWNMNSSSIIQNDVVTITTKQATQQTIDKGTYVWNDSLNFSTSSIFDVSINFISYETNYIGMITVPDDIRLKYINSDDEDENVYTDGWAYDENKTIEVTADTSVDEDFYTWFTANTTKQESTSTHKLTFDSNITITVNGASVTTSPYNLNAGDVITATTGGGYKIVINGTTYGGQSTININNEDITIVRSTAETFDVLLVTINYTETTAPTYSFKHFYLDEELIGDGTYKFKHWSQVEKPKLATPTNLSISDSTLSWDEVENATSYDIYVDDVVVGTYVVEQALIATVSGLGSANTSNVTFDVPSDFKFTDGEFTDSDGNVFVKIPKMYRKINATSDGQITSFSISNAKIDDDYKLYPVFLEEDGVTELDYVGIGKYMNKSSTKVNSVENGSVVSMRISIARSNIKENYSYGKYQLYDWMFLKLWQDLIICKMQTININSGSGITTDQLGIYWGNSYQWVDGFGHVDNYVYLCDKPSKYVNSPTASSDGYFTTSYRIATTSGLEIQKLGYDEMHPFVNLPSAVISNSSYNTYYCSAYWYSSGNRPFYCRVGDKLMYDGAFHLFGNDAWTYTYGVRLCYRPIGE